MHGGHEIALGMLKSVMTIQLPWWYSPVILWFDPKLIATQTISTVSSTQKNMLYNISKVPGNPSGGK